MRKVLGSVIVITCTIGMSKAFAHGGHKACAPIWKACSKANKGNKDAIKQCMETIKGGGTVPNVTVSEADATACKNGPSEK